MSRTQYPFIPTNPDGIVEWMAAKYAEQTGVTVQPGSPERLFIQWAASVVIQERALANYIANQNLPSRAVGENLDALAELFYTQERPRAKAATCTMRFTISEPQAFAVLIPKGTRVTGASGTLVWETVGDVYVAAGETSASVEVQSQRAGKVGNGYGKGQINSIMDPFAYFLSCENVTESAGGADEASDEAFYELLRASQDAYSTAGARGGYIYHAKRVSTEIADVKAISPSAGEVALYVLMKDGKAAQEETKKAVLAACSADTVRPLTDHVSVEDPQVVEYDIAFTYYIPSGAPVGAAEIEAAVGAAVEEYEAWQSGKLGRDINPSHLIGLLMQTGVKRVALTAPPFTALKDGGDGAAPQVAKRKTVRAVNGGFEDE